MLGQKPLKRRARGEIPRRFVVLQNMNLLSGILQRYTCRVVPASLIRNEQRLDLLFGNWLRAKAPDACYSTHGLFSYLFWFTLLRRCADDLELNHSAPRK